MKTIIKTDIFFYKIINNLFFMYFFYKTNKLRKNSCHFLYICISLNNKKLDNLEKYIESLIFASEQPIKIEEIKYVIENSFDTNISYPELDKSINILKEKYRNDEFSFEIMEISNGYSFVTKPAYHNIVGQYLKALTNKKLSKASLETLAIIAYKQPVTKPEIEEIRGVNCDYSIQRLLEKNLIEIQGRDDGPGRPLIYMTSEKFMDYFGLNSIKDLPGIKDFEENENSVGKQEEE